MESMLPNTCSLKFSDPHKLHDFYLIVCPDEGFWHGGKFWFHIYITEEYNMAASIVKFIFGTKFEISGYTTSYYSFSAKVGAVIIYTDKIIRREINYWTVTKALTFFTLHSEIFSPHL